MKTEEGYIDWWQTEKEAKAMDSYQLHYAILDCQNTLKVADEWDRLNFPRVSRGGYYRDCISVYRLELDRRKING